MIQFVDKFYVDIFCWVILIE